MQNLRTSSNQLVVDPALAGFEKQTPKEEKIIFDYPAFFRLDTLNGEQIGIRMRLLDLSRFGCRVSSDTELELTAETDSLIEGSIESDKFRYDRTFEGIIVRHSASDSAGHEYGLSFNQALNVDFIHSLLKAGDVIDRDVDFFRTTQPPHEQAMALRYRIRHTVERLLPHLTELERNISIYNYELNDTRRAEITKILYLKLKPMFDDIRDISDRLFEDLEEDPAVLQYNFDYLRKECRDILFSDPFIKRATEKPLGYAGDFEMMEALYRNENEGFNLFGQALHRWVMEMDSARAVKGRQHYFYELIKDRLERLTESGRERLVVLSLACGPAQEIVTLIKNTDQELLDKIDIYLLDQDPRAVVQARHGIRVAMLEKGRTVNYTTINKELSRFLKAAPRFLGRPIDLIYSAGLFDYIKLNTARKICARLYNLLSTGGEIYLGNFTDESREKGMMELMDWRLIYRSDKTLLGFAGQIEGRYAAEVVEDISPQRYVHITRK